MAISKAFDTITHDLWIAKLHYYRMKNNFLELLQNFSKKRWKRTKLDSTYISWSKLLHGVPQGSILDPLLFDIINDLCYDIYQSNICNFTGNTTPHASGFELNDALLRIKHDSNILFEWFRDNFMTLNLKRGYRFMGGVPPPFETLTICTFTNVKLKLYRQ